MHPILEIPLQFINEYLNRRWVILVIILLVIYFTYLRQWYFNRDSFVTNKKINKSQITNKKQNTNKIKKTKSEKIETFIDKPSSNISIEVSNNLFVNLQLNDSQMNSVLDNYKNIIYNTITNLIQLSEQQKTNPYLRVDKSFRKIIADGVDNIINFITITIKSQYSLTRTDVKTDMLQTLKLNINNQIDSINTQLTKEMNLLATMNSTTLDYNTELTKINDLRKQLDNLMNSYQIIINNGNNDSNNTVQINKALNKSNVLPIYEKNLDRLNQVLNSDFNGNEEKLTEKYGKMYTQFLEEEKSKELDINPLQLGSKIESGIVDILTGLFSTPSPDIIPKVNDKITSNNLVEQYGFTDNTLSRPMKNIIPGEEPLPLQSGTLNDKNIFIDSGNRGSYLIDNKTRKSITEGFQNESKPNEDDNTNKIYGFSNYILDTIKNVLGPSYSTITSKFNTYNINDMSNTIKLEDNMIPAGFLLFLLSMFLYFIDITS